MNRSLRLVVLVLATLVLAPAAEAQDASRAERRAKAKALFQQGNRKEAHELLVALCAEPKAAPAEVAEDLVLGCQCLAHLQRLDDLDGFSEPVIARHGASWRVAAAAAHTYL